MPVSFHRLAAREYVAARNWYGRRSPGTAAGFTAALGDAVATVEVNPAAGSPIFGRFRWVRLRHFPYLMYYETVGSDVLVYAIGHAKRRPGYWLRRVFQP